MRITYVFVGNRKDRYYSGNIESYDFFYGINFFNNQNYYIQIIEPSTKINIIKTPLKLIDFIFKKIFSLPVYLYEFTTFKNLKTLLNSDKVILVNETTFCSLAPILFMIKIFKKLEVYVFVMGLYSKKLRFPSIKKIHFLLIKLFSIPVDKFLFLGEAEYSKANKIHNSIGNKFLQIPFYVDTNFWNNLTNLNIKDRNTILFVGNDGNRNSELFLSIVKEMENYNFEAVTNIPDIVNSKLPNLTVLKGSSENQNLTDLELKNAYINCKFVIIPLKNTFQPSGQSVTLQAMSCKRTVLISEIDGLWDKKSFRNNFVYKTVHDNTVNCWKSEIETLFNNEHLIETLEQNAANLVRKKLNFENFEKKLTEILNLK